MAAPLDFVRNAPVTSLTTAESLVGAVLTFLATHHVLGDIDVSATTQTIAPFVALVLPALFGALKWRLVTPVAKVRELAERDGLVSDADFARLGAMLDDKLAGWGLEAIPGSAEATDDLYPAEHRAVDDGSDQYRDDDADADDADADDADDTDDDNADAGDADGDRVSVEGADPPGMSAGAT